ncbi:hypothetical protein [Enterobacter sp. UPMP2052]
MKKSVIAASVKLVADYAGTTLTLMASWSRKFHGLAAYSSAGLDLQRVVWMHGGGERRSFVTGYDHVLM